MKSITVQELHDLLPSLTDKEVIVDVRSASEFEEEHVAGAVNMPLNEIMSKTEELQQYETVYCICYSGSRSYLAVTQLALKGVKHGINVSGGMSEWTYAGFKTT